MVGRVVKGIQHQCFPQRTGELFSFKNHRCKVEEGRRLLSLLFYTTDREDAFDKQFCVRLRQDAPAFDSFGAYPVRDKGVARTAATRS